MHHHGVELRTTELSPAREALGGDSGVVAHFGELRARVVGVWWSLVAGGLPAAKEQKRAEECQKHWRATVSFGTCTAFLSSAE